MPDSRTDSLVQLAQDTARRITGSHTAWMAYLQTAARLYKYPYHEQLLIFAQRPQATACAGYEVWKNTMRRYVRRGSTLLIRKMKETGLIELANGKSRGAYHFKKI